MYPFSLCGPQHSSGEYFPIILLLYYLNVNKLISFQSFAVVYPYDNNSPKILAPYSLRGDTTLSENTAVVLLASCFNSLDMHNYFSILTQESPIIAATILISSGSNT